jgi:hypothetical protein
LKSRQIDVCAIYLPGFQTNDGSLSGGDSDHTSFNNNGYMGIFPFEDSQDYSPYIHTANDLIGPSVNNFEQHKTFVQAIIANVATMAGELATPENLTAIAGDQQVVLEWEAVATTDHYNIYRNLEPDPYSFSVDTSFTDTDVINGTSYSYYVTAVFQDSGDESGPSNVVTAIPMPPISLPFYDDFETGAPYWMKEGTWGLQTGTYHSSSYSLTESPLGNYEANMEISTTLSALNFSGAYSAQISFWTLYNIESGYDYMYLEVSANGSDWEQIASFTGDQYPWVEKVFPLDNFLGESNVIIRFRFTSDVYVEDEGMFIDDLEVMVNGIGIDEEMTSPVKTNLLFHPNPAQTDATINFWLETSGMTKIILNDSKGMTVKTLFNSWEDAGIHSLELDLSGLPAGVYLGTLENNGLKISRKLVITR